MTAPARAAPRLLPHWLRIAALVAISAAHAAALGGLARFAEDSPAPPGVFQIGVVARGEIAFEARATPVPDRAATPQPPQDAAEPEPQSAPSQETTQSAFDRIAARPSEEERSVREDEEPLPLSEEPPKPAALASPVPPAASQASARSLGADDKGERENSSANARYAALVSAEINRRKYYPAQARLRGENGAVGVAFAIGSSGQVTRQTVTRSSGSRVLDEAATGMVASARLPPPPLGTFAGEIVITFRVRP